MLVEEIGVQADALQHVGCWSCELDKRFVHVL